MSKLLKAEYQIAKTGTDQISLKEMNSTELISYFLRDVRGRPQLAEDIRNHLQEISLAAQIEDIRTHVERRELKKAKALIDACVTDSSLDRSELLLESSRYYFFSEEIDMAIEILNCLISSKDCAPTSKMTAHELLGQCYYQQNRMDRAIKHLKKSAHQLDFLPYVYSGFVAGAYLVKILAEQKDFLGAKDFLNFLLQKLDLISDEESWLSRKLLFLRAQFHFQRINGELDTCKTTLNEAYVISKWLEDHNMVGKCSADFIEYGFKKPKESNVSFLADSKILLVQAPKFLGRFDNSPVLAKILINLLSGPIKSEELFFQVYGYAFDKERHATHLRSTLSKLRKKLPHNFLSVKDGSVSLIS